MSRWLILSMMATGLAAAPLLAQDPAAPKTKAKAEPKAEASKTKTETKPKSESKPKTEAPKPEILDEKTVKERASYGIGMSVGRNVAQGIKQDGAEVDIDALLRGIKDVLTKTKPAYTDQEMTAAIEAFGKVLEAKAA